MAPLVKARARCKQQLLADDAIAVINLMLHEPLPAATTIIQGIPEKSECFRGCWSGERRNSD